MTDDIIAKVKDINDRERDIRERKFEIMRELGVISWEQVQALVIAHLEEKRNDNA